jgi:hypothetical protein
MQNFICITCGTQYAETEHPPTQCKICTDERQYVGWQGQQWTTLGDLQKSHQLVVRLEEADLYGIGMEPSFAIGQRALLVMQAEGNILWDCIPLIDDGLVKMVKGIGGISAIAIRTRITMQAWSNGVGLSIARSTCTQPTGSG